jgi:hypothetical protein
MAQIEKEIEDGKDCWYLAEDKYDQLVACTNFSVDHSETGGVGIVKILAGDPVSE